MIYEHQVIKKNVHFLALLFEGKRKLNWNWNHPFPVNRRHAESWFSILVKKNGHVFLDFWRMSKSHIGRWESNPKPPTPVREHKEPSLPGFCPDVSPFNGVNNCYQRSCRQQRLRISETFLGSITARTHHRSFL